MATICEDGELIFFGIRQAKIGQIDTLLLERAYTIRSHWKELQVSGVTGDQLVLWKDRSSVVRLVDLNRRDHGDIYLLLRSMDEGLPYIGGFNPSCWFKNPWPMNGEGKRVCFDSRLLLLFFNANEYLQQKLAEEVGTSRVALVERVKEVLEGNN